MMNDAYSEIAEIIFASHGDAVGVAYLELDCGCARLCGVSRQGAPVGDVFNVSGQPSTRNLEPLVCLKCYRDKGFAVQRAARQGILWADAPPRRTGPEERMRIGHVVFGDDFRI
jgi:hypothetical protein